MHFDDVSAVFEGIFDADRLGGEFAKFTHGNEAAVQEIGERCAKDKATRFDTNDGLNTSSGIVGSEPVKRGSKGSSTVTVTAVNGSSSVNLSASGLPKGVSASFAPTSVTGSATSTLTVSASRNAGTGNFNLTVTGNNGSTTHTATLMVAVQ